MCLKWRNGPKVDELIPGKEMKKGTIDLRKG